MHELGEQLLLYLKSAWKFRWYGAAGAWLVAVAGWIAVSQLPDRYEASARVYVDTQSILRPLLAGLAMQPNDNQIVEMMSRTLISRPNVERVIKIAEIDAGSGNPADLERTVNRLTRDLTIRNTSAQKNFFTITYNDRDPQQAKRVVQALLGIFVEGSQGNKRMDSDSARSFIDDQLKSYAERLTAAENAVTEFKRRHVGLMPGQGENFYTRLGEAKTALNQARLELMEAEQGRDAIRRQLQADARARQDDRPAPENAAAQAAAPPVATPEIDARIQALQQKLDGLRLSYTERHPDIVAAAASLEQLKEQKQREMDRLQREARTKKPAPAAAQAPDLVAQQLSISMAEFEASVASLKVRVAEYERRLGELKAATNAIPQVEAEFTQLTRDYEVTKRNYDQLVQRREAAQLTADMQSNSGVMDFRVIDPPQVPSTPNWPNRPLFVSIVFLLALGAGVGVALLISQLRPTINSERRLREVGGVEVFGTVVMGWTEEQKRQERMGLSALIACLIGLLIVYGAIMALPMLHRITSAGSVFQGS